MWRTYVLYFYFTCFSSVKMDFEEEALLLLLLQRRMRRSKKRQFWVHPIIENKNESQFNLLYNLLSRIEHKIREHVLLNNN